MNRYSVIDNKTTFSSPNSHLARYTVINNKTAHSRSGSQMAQYMVSDNKTVYSRPNSQMTLYTANSPPPYSRHSVASPLLLSRPSSVMSRTSRPPASIKLTKASPMQCKVCKHTLDYQWILPGLHNFCTHCLEDYILRHSRGKHCHCPICRAGIRLPKAPKQEKKLMRRPYGTDVFICDACEDCPAFYKCSECSEFFCEKCNKLHLRMKVGRNHHVNIVPSIRALNENLQQKVYCDDHEHEEIRFFCTKCEVPICRDCKVIQHDGHPIVSLKEVLEDKKTKVSILMTSTKGHLARMTAEAVTIRNRKIELVEEMEHTISEIRQHANRLKDIVDEHVDNLVMTVRQQHDESVAKLNTCLEAIDKKAENIKCALATTAVQMDMSTDIAFLNASNSLMANLRDVDVPTFTDKLWRKKMNFVKGKIENVPLQQSVGELKFAAEGLFVPLPAIELQLHATFSTDQNFHSPTSIACLPDGTAWLCCGYKNKLQRFNSRGLIVQEETTDFDIDDMTTLMNGIVLVTEYNGKAIRKLGFTKLLSYFAKTDLYLRGIATSRDGTQVFVVGNDVNVTKVKQTHIARVLVLSIMGKKIREIQMTRGLSLFRVCHTVNSDLVLSTGSLGKYLVVNEDGTTKYTYSASGSADGVACDAHGLTILVDSKDDTLHLLDSKGKPLPFTYSLSKPNAVAVDNRGYIWVGDHHKVRIMKYV